MSDDGDGDARLTMQDGQELEIVCPDDYPILSVKWVDQGDSEKAAKVASFFLSVDR
jgi:hypothetical protein